MVPVGRVAAGRKMGRLRRRLEVAVGTRRWRRREGRHAAGGRRPRQLLLEGHRLRLRLDLEGRDVAPDREVRAVLRARLRLRVAHRRQALRASRHGVGAARVAVRVPDARPARRSRILGKRRGSLVNAARQSCVGAWRWSRSPFTRASARAGQNSAAVRAADSALHLNMKYKLSLVLRRAAARAGEEIVYHYTKESQTCVLAS